MRPTVFTVPLLLPWFLPAQNDTITGDGIFEMAVLYNLQVGLTETSSEGDTLAEIIVYRRNSNGWEVWPEATGLMMYAHNEYGFTRFSAEIERGALGLRHYPGGRTSISFTHRFRWQNGRFEIIGATYSVYERCGRARRQLGYNLSTGNYDYREYNHDCDSAIDNPNVTTKFMKGQTLRKTPLLQSTFSGWDNEVVMQNGEAMGF
jgi:hypothetical protein